MVCVTSIWTISGTNPASTRSNFSFFLHASLYSPTCVRRYLVSHRATVLPQHTVGEAVTGKKRRGAKTWKYHRRIGEQLDFSSRKPYVNTVNVLKVTHTQTLLASLWRWIHEIDHRAWLFPAGFPHSAGLSEVKYHPRVGFGGSLMTSQDLKANVKANHHGGKFYTLSGTLLPDCMWWQSTHNANIIFLHLEFFRTTFKTTCSGWKTQPWSLFPHLFRSLTTSEASCSIHRQRMLFWWGKSAHYQVLLICICF